MDSERITADLGLVGIFSPCDKTPRPEASKCNSSSKVKVQNCGLPLDFYSLSGEEPGVLCERGVEVSGPGFRQGVNGVYTLDFDIWIEARPALAFDTPETLEVRSEM